jgi:hypothetical protein
VIQTTEVWVVVCDKCHKPYGKSFQSKYYMVQEAIKLGGWEVDDRHALCSNCCNGE